MKQRRVGEKSSALLRAEKEETMRAVARKKFTDKYTGEVYEAGSLLDITPERYKEIRKTDANLVIAVADEPGAAGQSAVDDAGTEDGKTEPGAVGQSTADDAKAEDGKTDTGAAGQSAAEDAGTADGKKKPKKKTEKSTE